MNNWTLSNLPPKGHADVGEYFAQKVREGEDEKHRLGLYDRWLFNHRMFRGDHWDERGAPRTSLKKITMNLLFANIQRTVANLTAKQPLVEAIEIGGDAGHSTDKVLTAWLKKWWNDTNQSDTLLDSAHEMEIYGPTIEKAIYNGRYPDITVIDPFAFGKAPGVFDDIQDAPYLYHKAIMRCDEVERLYGLEEGSVNADEIYTEMGEVREEQVPTPINRQGTVPSGSGGREYRTRRAAASKDREMTVVTEVWVWDYSGEYQDNVRVVTFTNNGKLVLDDTHNPNVNWTLFEQEPKFVSRTYHFGRFPFSIGHSYKDKTTNWGFSTLEQTADINMAIEELLSRLNVHMNKALLPVLIVPKDTGIKPTHINNKPGLILRPNTSMQAGQIRYMDPPRVSLDVYKYLEILRGFFDQVWHIEDADRGERPTGIIAAQAIRELQERNAVLMRAKIRTIDKLVEHRGKSAISMLQNFGTEQEIIRMEDEVAGFMGIDLIGKDYSFVVESGSTVHKTTMQIQEQAVELYRMGAIDRQAMLQVIDFPGWKRVVERTGEGQLDQALQILVDAGLDENQAAELKQYLLQPQEEEQQ